MADDKPPDDEFFDIAAQLVYDEANEHLDKRLKLTEKWLNIRRIRGQRADLRALIDHLRQESDNRGATVVCLAAALWRIKEMEKANVK